MKNGPIIIIDDDEDDLELCFQALKELKVENEIIVFQDSLKFWEFISTTTERPFFILCDINMGKLSGFDLKKMIMDEERLRLKCIPFLMFSTSSASPSICEAYSINVQGYFVKPANYNSLKTMLQSMIIYWNFSEHP